MATIERAKLRIGVATVVPVLTALLIAALDAREAGGRPRLPCPLYPNGVVAFAAELHERCTLEPGDTILAIAREGSSQPIHSARELTESLATDASAVLILRRSGESADRRISVLPVSTPASTLWITLGGSMVLAILLVAFVLLTAVRSGSPAAAPFAAIHSCMGVLLVAAVAGWTSARSYPLTALARVVLPAAVVHLAFVFPRMREVAVRVPGIHRVAYGVGFAFLALELDATYRGAGSTMILIQRIETAATVVAVFLLCFSSWLSMRESPSRLERGQAKVFLTGLALLVAATWAGTHANLPGGSLTAVTLGVALSPLPLGYAIASHHLFAFDMTWRRAVSQVVYLSVWSGLFFVGVIVARARLPIPEWLRHPVVMYAGVYAVLAPLDGFRQLLKRFIERAFQLESKTWTKLSEGRASRLAHLRDADSIALAAVELAAESCPGAGVALFLGDARAVRLAHAAGALACRDPNVAALGFRYAGPSEVVDLNRVDTIEPEAATLWHAGIEVLAVVATGSFVHGILVLCPPRRGKLQPSSRILWLRLVCVHAAAAFENARLTEQLRLSEEFAMRGRMHAELAHEIGKPLGALEVLVQRLSADSAATRSLRERSESILRLAAQLREIVRGVLGTGRSRDRVEVAELIERACREMASVHGEGRVLVPPLPDLPPLDRRADRAVRALSNLIDNAIRATGASEPIEVRARAYAGGIEIEVADRGCGIGDADLARVFDAFVSLRPGGHGLGLTISRQIAEQLGGALVLESAPGRGTLARLRLPAGGAS